MEKRRYTHEEIAKLAQTHVAYGWAKTPGTHRNDIEWTPEDTKTYNDEFEKAQKGN